jgi:hypothetical protein
MALDRVKLFVLKYGALDGDITAHQSGYPGGAPARINSAGAVARCYSDNGASGYIGIYANGSTDTHGLKGDQSGNPVTYYFGPGIYTLEKSATNPVEASYPYDSTATYAIGNAIGIGLTTAAGQWSNSYGSNTIRGVVLAVGTVSGGVTTSLTVQMF